MAGNNVKFELEGMDKLSRTLRSLSAEVRSKVAEDVQNFSLQIANEAKMSAPVDMGVLRSSISIFYANRGLTSTIATTCGYGAYVEYGTGPLGKATWSGPLPPDYVHGSGGKMPPLDIIKDWCRRHKIPEKVAFVIARKIGRNGLRARPYFTPAWLKARRDFLKEWSDIEELARRVRQ